jgi:formylglycine-generating enzyme required for sulfatase activity
LTDDRSKEVWKQLAEDRDNAHAKLYELAQIPFWLAIMAEVAGPAGLPPSRSQLADLFVRNALAHEADRSGGIALDDQERRLFRQALIDLAWRGLLKSEHHTFSNRSTRRFFRKVSRRLPPADCLLLARDCHLLELERQKVRFKHQLFQEYFASMELARRFASRKKFHIPWKRLDRLWRIPWRDWHYDEKSWGPLPPPPTTGWEEATVMAAGQLDGETAARLAQAVLPLNPPLAERCLSEAGPDFGPQVKKVVAARLLDDLTDPRMRLPARLASGKALARLGDPRILQGQGKVLVPEGKEQSFIEPAWVEVPAGVFFMGSQDSDKQAYDHEKPAHPVRLSSAYRIGRFPVTVVEYRCFIQAGGYQQERFWQGEAALRWLKGELRFEESYQYFWFVKQKQDWERVLPGIEKDVKEGRQDPSLLESVKYRLSMSDDEIRSAWEEIEAEHRDENRRADRPWLWEDRRFKAANQPVVGVTWYEAQAYAAWVNECLHRSGRLEAAQHCRLPYEAEWEKAARGEDGRLYPWGDAWDKNNCNTLEGRVMLPSPVGAYPQGAGPCGALDMAGNVWEWCTDWYDEQEYARQAAVEVVDPQGPLTGQLKVLRGGSWSYYRRLARCASRHRNLPGGFLAHYGFRLVVSPD